MVVTQTCEDIINQAEAAVSGHKNHIRDLQDRGEPISSSLRQKAILFTYQTVSSINAETVIARYYELKAVVEHFKRVDNLDAYEIPVDNLKPTMNWTVEWGHKDDAHLLIGVWRHGFGSWEQISQVSWPPREIGWALADGVQDPTLHLESKIFLEDPKTKGDSSVKPGIPGPIHLVRRGDYLCGLVREYEENRRALIEQNALIAKMPVREGFGFEQPSLPVSAGAGPSRSQAGAAKSPSVTSSVAPAPKSSAAKAKRRKTPEYTDSEDDSGQ